MSIARFFMLACLALILQNPELLSPRAQSSQSPPDGSLSAQAAQSQMLFTVVDKEGHFVTALQAADVRLLVDDKPQEIVALRKLANQPLALAILIDTSISQERTLPGQKLAADAFVQRIIREGTDQCGVITFTGRATIEQELTSQVGLVRQAIARVKFIPPPGYMGGGVVITDPSILGGPKRDSVPLGSTAIWDSIWATCEEMFPATLAGAKKAIILLSDGYDTSSKTKLREAIERAAKASVAVYAIGIGERQREIDDSALRKVSEQTGGRAFIPKKAEDLVTAFAEIQEELRNQYEITYRSAAGKTSSPRKIRLEIVNPALRAEDLKMSYQRIAASSAK